MEPEKPYTFKDFLCIVLYTTLFTIILFGPT